MPWDWETYPAVHGRARSSAQGRQPAALRADESADGLRDGHRGSPRPAACRPTTSIAMMRRICSTKRWTPAPADGRRSGSSPTGLPSVQRDFDGSPMNTDVMHDETCIEMAKVLGERGEGFQELTLVELGSEGGCAPFREARGNQRPSDHVRGGADAGPLPASPSQHDRVARALPSERPSGLRPGRHHRCRPDLHLRGLEPVRRLRRVARSDHRHASRSARRSSAIPRRRRCAQDQMPRESLITSYFDRSSSPRRRRPRTSISKG